MYKVACPGCGADVAFKSAASVLSACEYCQTTVLRTDEGVRDLGKRAALFEDYSPIQLGTTGVFNNKAFTVLGRIQMRYEAGFWNEWFIAFEDNTHGWFSDASGQYTILKDAPALPDATNFEALHPGMEVVYEGKTYIGADVRHARAAGFEGELPFALGEGWAARVADFRSTNQFLTLDYSDSEVPQTFRGESVELKNLKLQLLRDDAAITGTSSKLKAPVKSVPCPNCGSVLSYVDGVAAHMHCGSCHSEVSCTADVAEVLAKHRVMVKPPLTLHPGDEGSFSGVKWRVMGALTREECDVQSGERWTEYLLHNTQKGFLWLVETADGWSMTQVLDVWPTVKEGVSAKLGNEQFKHQYTYEAKVVYVVGAFNWKAQVGDLTTIYSYAKGNDTLDAEVSDTEMTWSRSQDIATDTVLKAFKRETNTEAFKAAEVDTYESDHAFLRVGQVVVTVILLFMLIWALVTGRSMLAPFAGLFLTWVPFTFQGVLDLLDL